MWKHSLQCISSLMRARFRTQWCSVVLLCRSAAAGAGGRGRGPAGAEERKPAAGEGEAQPGDTDPPSEVGQEDSRRWSLNPGVQIHKKKTPNRTLNSSDNKLPTEPLCGWTTQCSVWPSPQTLQTFWVQNPALMLKCLILWTTARVPL